MNAPVLRAAAVAMLMSLSGCYSTTVTSGLPPGPSPLSARERWHSGFVAGIAEASGPYELSAFCPHGWSRIETETSFWNGLVEALTGIVYSPQTVTIVCAAAPPPAPGFAPAPLAPPLPPPR